MTHRTLATLSLLLIAFAGFASEATLMPSLPVLPMLPPSNTGTVSGSVTTVSGSLITILNGALTIDAAGATFHGRRGSASIADVKPGSQIVAQIKNPQAPAGTLPQASNIVILDPPAAVLNGPVQSVDVAGSALTMFGTRIAVTPNTRIQILRIGNGSGTLADIQPGSNATVELSINGSTLVAESILVIAPLPNKIVEGSVKSITPTSWVITTRDEDVTVAVNAQTRIESNIQTGDDVIVTGSVDSNGLITALLIVKRPVIPPVSDFALNGTVKSMGASTWVITTNGNNDVTIAINSNTRIDRSIKAGDAVLVLAAGRRDDAGNLIAIAIMKTGRNRSAGR